MNSLEDCVKKFTLFDAYLLYHYCTDYLITKLVLLLITIIKLYIFSPSCAANFEVIVAKLLCTEVAKFQTRSAMNIIKNTSSVPETMPRGPFINSGRFNMFISRFFALKLIMQ